MLICEFVEVFGEFIKVGKIKYYGFLNESIFGVCEFVCVVDEFGVF